MSKSAILSSSIVKKYWMALTGLFLCLFLVGHLVGNLQLIMIHGEEGKRAFNEYAYFMTHNPFIKIMSYLTYFSILFHAIDGIYLTIQNKKARPKKYAYNKPSANSSTPSRYMAILGTAVLVFISTHMVNFWGKMHFTQMPLHTYVNYPPNTENPAGDTVFYTISKQGIPKNESIMIKDGNKLFLNTDYMKEQIELAKIQSAAQGQPFDEAVFSNMDKNGVIAEGYKDLHGAVFAFFGKKRNGFPTNEYASLAVLLYVLSMAVLGFHLWHGFASAFQTLGLRSKKFVGAISIAGKVFAVLVPLAFAIIPIYILLS